MIWYADILIEFLSRTKCILSCCWYSTVFYFIYHLFCSISPIEELYSLFYSVSSIYSILFHVAVHILCISVCIHYICIWSLEIDPIPAVVRQLTPADGHQCADLSCWQLWTCHRQGRGWPGWGRHPMRFKLTSVENTLIVKKTSFKGRNFLKHLYLSSIFLFCFESWGNGNRKKSMGFTLNGNLCCPPHLHSESELCHQPSKLLEQRYEGNDEQEYAKIQHSAAKSASTWAT